MSALLSIAVLAAGPAASPGKVQTFGDWVVGCDNLHRCTMGSLVPEDDTDPGPQVTISLSREAGRDGRFAIGFAGDSGAAEIATQLRIDRRTFPVAALSSIAAAMVHGTRLTIAGSTISLAGAAAALRYIDAAQSRVGTVTAVVAKGKRPTAVVPPAPPAPVVRSLQATGDAARLSDRALTDLAKQADCLDEEKASPHAEYHALGGGRTVMLLSCASGPYNASAAVFVIAGRTARPAVFDVVPAGGGDTVPMVVNGAFEHGKLTSAYKGRGLGDCGIWQGYAWDGARFRLVEQAEIPTCRGNLDAVITWRASVVRR